MMDMTDRDVLAEGAGIKNPGRYGIWNGLDGGREILLAKKLANQALIGACLGRKMPLMGPVL